jgi:two-component system cell cycle sensor histidine kinase/response regulator CckA
MKMITKLSIVIFLIVSLSAFTIVIYRIYEEKKITQFFHNEQDNKETNFTKLMDLKRQDIEKALNNYTYWDDMVFFVTIGQNEKWAEDNINTMLTDFSINSIWIYNIDSSLIYSVNNFDGNFLEKNLLPKEAFGKLFKQERFCHFYINTPKGLMDINGATIHPTDDPKRKAPFRGYFFVGRLIDKNYIAELSKLIDGMVELVSVSDMAKSENTQGKKGSVIQFYKMLKGWDSTPLTYLKVTIESNVVSDFSSALTNASIIFISIILITIIIVLTFFFHWINDPLKLISDTLITENPDYISKLQKSKNEFGDIAILITRFFEQKQKQIEYQTIIHASIDGFMIGDIHGHILDVNNGYCQVLGYTRDEILNMNMMDIVANESLKQVAQYFSKLTSVGHTRFETKHRRYNGSIMDVEVSAAYDKNNSKYYAFISDITERKQAEEKLRENEERYHNIIANAGGVAYQRDWLNETYTFMDEGIINLTGYSSDEMTPNLFIDLINDENHGVYDKKIIHSEVSHQVGEGIFTLYQGEYYIRTKDGQKKCLADSALELRDNDNNIIQSMGMLQDITERKLSEKQLMASEIKYRTLFNSLVDAVSILDMEGRFLEVNDAYVERLGYSSEELLNMNVRDINSSENAELVLERLKQLKDGRLKFFEAIHIANDGRRIPVEVGGRGIEYNGIPAVLNIVRDITERKQGEYELRQSDERYRIIIQTAMEGFWLADFQGRLLEVNDTYCRMSGYSEQELLDMNISDLEVIESSSDISAHVQKVITCGEDFFETCHRRKDGSIFDVEVSVQYLPIEEQRLVAFLRDITERKKGDILQEKLRQTSKMESIGRLAGGVAHDFNNLLTVIQGSASLGIKGLNKNDPLYNRLKMIQEASERAEDLTRQLLAFSRKQIIEMKVINLNNLIDNFRKMLSRLIGEDIDLQTILSNDISNINADAGQMEQIIVNLSVNARDAMPNGGKLTIETANVELDEAYCQTHADIQPGKYIMLTLSDNGIGMDDAIKEHIFEPFFTTKGVGEGTGLGLAIVYGVVKQHNGSIEFYSELGHGTTFKIYLPIVEDKVSVQSKESEKPDLLIGNETILVVEDDGIVREIAVEFLMYLGYKVLSAENGGMALIIAEQHEGSIQLMLTDVVMPNINGRQLAERLQREYPEMKVLYTSGYTGDVIAHHDILDSGLNFIGKPYKLQSLAKKIRDVLDKK